MFLTAAGVAADLVSKQVVFRSLLADADLPQRVRQLVGSAEDAVDPARVLRALRISRPVIDGFRLTISTNPGVVFGLPMPSWAVAFATMFTMGLVAYFFATSPAAARWVHVALAAILAGALGNFYDRVVAAVHVPGVPDPVTGQVRDFLDFSEIRFMGLNYPYIFNIADVLLVIGVAMLILHWAFAGRRTPGRAAAQGPRGKG